MGVYCIGLNWVALGCRIADVCFYVRILIYCLWQISDTDIKLSGQSDCWIVKLSSPASISSCFFSFTFLVENRPAFHLMAALVNLILSAASQKPFSISSQLLCEGCWKICAIFF